MDEAEKLVKVSIPADYNQVKNHGMDGYVGTNPEKIRSYSHHLGSLHFSSAGESRQESGAIFSLTGHLLRFINTDVIYNRENPLSSLLRLYRQHGEGFVSRLDGLFLLLFQPSESEPTFIVNNRAEANRLYVHRGGDGFYFSSSLRRLLRDSKMHREPDLGSIRSFLANGFTISERVQIRGVEKLLPADYLVISGEHVEKKSYWKGDLKFERKQFGDLESHLDTYEKTYRGGLERFFESKNPKGVAALLSGGHDTSFLVAQATQVLKQPLHCYTVTFPGWRFDEGAPARNIAEKFGAKFHAVPFRPEHLDSIVSLIDANEEPVVGSSLPLHVLSRQAGETADTLLGGDGGDTLWGEYYPVGEYHRWVHRLPLAVRKFLHQGAKILRDGTDWERFWELEHVARLFTEEDYHSDFLRKLCTYRHFDEKFQSNILSPELMSAPYARSYNEIPFTDENFPEALIEGKLYNGFYTYQSFHTGKSAAYFGMDLFLPTVDKELIDFITTLPMEWVNGGTTVHRLMNNKSINRKFHKKALSRYLKKEEIYNRSFDIPWYNILRPRRELLTHLLKRLKERGWYREEALDLMFSEFLTQKVKEGELLELKHHGYRIFTLLSLEIWSRRFLDAREETADREIPLEEVLA